ncbi:MAG: hypothetical protein IKQ10_07385 [Oscillospiraceae bacterium]|nr:hypothetical protein [Oscillospiraceae bacterium]
MLDQNTLFDALADADDAYIQSAASLLGYEKEDNMRSVPFARRRLSRAVLIAAVIAALLAVTVMASFFAFSTRVPAADETFRIHWSDAEGGYLDWKNAKLVVSFPETAESNEVEFRPGWLPFALPEKLPLSDPWQGLTDETWFRRFTAESLCWAELEDDPAVYEDISQPLEIEVYAMSQFNDGGAMLMLYQTPGEITEEHYDAQDADVLRFRGTQRFEARPEFGLPERTSEYSYVLLSNAREGWVIAVRGQLDMDTLVKVAKNLEIRPTGETATYDDFENHFLFFDGGVG